MIFSEDIDQKYCNDLNTIFPGKTLSLLRTVEENVTGPRPLSTPGNQSKLDNRFGIPLPSTGMSVRLHPYPLGFSCMRKNPLHHYIYIYSFYS